LSDDRAVIVFGAGGHGRAIAEAAARAGWRVAGFVDDDPRLNERRSGSTHIFGDREWLRRSIPPGCRVALGVGDNHARKAIAEFLQASGIGLATIVSSDAVISTSCEIGAGTVIMPGAVVNAGVTVGSGAILNTGSVVEHDTRIGGFAHIAPHATLGGGSQAGELAFVGMGAAVLPSIRIGKRCVLGALSLATMDIPDDVTAYGVPARIQAPRGGEQMMVAYNRA
jgi:sugar O-acyltransferase (sialic acid O-acetyltransferase NeuD family)